MGIDELIKDYCLEMYRHLESPSVSLQYNTGLAYIVQIEHKWGDEDLTVTYGDILVWLYGKIKGGE